jgi:hypothetical protein
MKLRKHMIEAVVCLMAILFIACGGSSSDDGGGSPSAPAPSAAVGVFKDSNVSGLQYTTSSGQSGTTDASGHYNYMTGDTVTFSVGGVALGSAVASGVVTPVDLVAGGSSSSTPVLNIVRFLMMIDANGDPDDGIAISAAVQAAAAAWTPLDFSDPGFDTLAAPLITECQTADGGAHLLPDAVTAQNHLEASVRCAYSGAFRGTFSGSDSGTFGVIVDPQTGEVRGVAYSNTYGDTTEAYGSGIVDYDQTMAFITGFVDTGATFSGQLATPDTMSGTWQDTSTGDHGNFSGNRIGGATESAYRYTGVAYNDDSSVGAVLAMDISGSTLTGIGYGVEDNDQFTFSGTLSGSSIDATASNGVLISGTINSDDTFSGTWYNPADGDSGTFDGCGCPLN